MASPPRQDGRLPVVGTAAFELRPGPAEGPHLQIRDIEDKPFQRWLTLFAETARQVLDARNGKNVIDRALARRRLEGRRRLSRLFVHYNTRGVTVDKRPDSL